MEPLLGRGRDEYALRTHLIFIAECHWALDELEEARAIFQELLEKSPDWARNARCDESLKAIEARMKREGR